MSNVDDAMIIAVERTLAEAGIEDATDLALLSVDRLKRKVGGQWVYVSASRKSREHRDRQIAKMFNGKNLRQVCLRFHVSRATVYRATKKVSRLQKK